MYLNVSHDPSVDSNVRFGRSHTLSRLVKLPQSQCVAVAFQPHHFILNLYLFIFIIFYYYNKQEAPLSRKTQCVRRA